MMSILLSKVIVSASSAAVALAFDAGGNARQEDIWVADLTEEEAKELLALHGRENNFEEFVNACVRENNFEEFVNACVSAHFNNMLIKICLVLSSFLRGTLTIFDQSLFQVACGLATW
eukprot:s597_g34.t1